jgi:DNA-binding PucR family transcriptional regulator
VLIYASKLSDADIEAAVDTLEKSIRVPASHHRSRPGIRLPVVIEWRGRVLVFAKAEWTGERRLRDALPTILGDGCVAVDSGSVAGCEALSDTVADIDYAASVAVSLGRSGWIGSPGELALETTFLLDDALVHAAVEQELGVLLADSRMGEELIETLEVYFGSRQNIREAARRLHLAPRTVAYRLERIETLLGQDLDGDVAMRLSAALMALRVTRQAGRS